jgi:hypothetical protein
VTRNLAVFTGSIAFLAGCTGFFDEPAGPLGDPRDRPPVLGDGAAPDAEDPLALAEDPGLRLLSLDQYQRTVRAAAQVLAPDYLTYNRYYSDIRLGFVRMSSDPTTRSTGEPPFSQLLGVAIAVTSELVPDRQGMITIMGECARAPEEPETVQRACLETMLRAKLPLIFRRTPTEEEVTYYRDEVARYPLTPEGLREVLVAIFLAPHFLFHVEHGPAIGGAATDGAATDVDPVVDLTGEELAARIAYLLWRSPPDEMLIEAGRSGQLADETPRRAQIERLLDDPRSSAFFRALVVQWLDLRPERLAFERVQSESFDLATAGALGYAPTRDDIVALGPVMIDELAAFVGYLARRGDRVGSLFSTEIALTAHPVLTAIYQVPAWDGAGEPPALARPRGGLLGHAAFFAYAANDTHPILTGVRVYRNLLCAAIANPPSVVTPGPLPTPPYTTRAEVEALTGSVSCQACHSLFNAHGFVFEAFDQIGQWRTEDPYFVNGAITASLPIDTRGTVALRDGAMVEIGSTVELASAIASSGMVEPCLARNLAVLGLDRIDPADETIDAVTETLRSGSMIDGIEALIASEAFGRRSFGEE